MTTATPQHHDPNLAHHFDTPQQQFDAGKLGIWLFLTTEILLFSGLFCAYAVYRGNHPEMFDYGHRFLDWRLGAVNTLVLIFSSLTIAWAVRAAQLGQQRLLVNLLAVTLVCGGVFMAIKAKEYYDKWDHATLWGARYDPHHGPGQHALPAPSHETSPALIPAPTTSPAATVPSSSFPTTDLARSPEGYAVQQTTAAPAAIGPRGLSPDWLHKAKPLTEADITGPEPPNVQVFFSIYFVMTGLHGLHVLAGMTVIAWILLRARRGDFGPGYYNPVDFTALYWHLVDLVWIFLFPLLYLIH